MSIVPKYSQSSWNVLCVAIRKLIGMEKLAKEINDIIALNAYKLSRSTFDTLYYRRQIEPEKMRMVLQAHVEGSSLRGISRTVNLAYNTVVNLVRAASQKGQMILAEPCRKYQNLTSQQ